MGFFALLLGVGRWLARRLNLRVQLRPDPPPPATAPGPTWQAMVCGRRIELGDSGFYITLDPSAVPQLAYSLFNPEDQIIAFGHNLQGLKSMGEQMARDRAEFKPAAVEAWRPNGARIGA